MMTTCIIGGFNMRMTAWCQGRANAMNEMRALLASREPCNRVHLARRPFRPPPHDAGDREAAVVLPGIADQPGLIGAAAEAAAPPETQ
jgi:hypothetical protein